MERWLISQKGTWNPCLKPSDPDRTPSHDNRSLALQSVLYDEQHRCYVWTSLYYADTLDCFIFLSLFPSPEALVQYNLVGLLCTIRSGSSFGFHLYNINLWATHTTILSTRGVTIPIYLVSSATDSIRLCVVLFKTVTILTSDPKSEFLCQLSLSCTEPTDPLNTSYAWDISHALITTYHPYCQSPSALTEYLK